MNTREIAADFTKTTALAVKTTADKCTDLFDLEEVTNEVAKASLERYRVKYPEIFKPGHKIKIVNMCFCGECRDALMMTLNAPLARDLEIINGTGL